MYETLVGCDRKPLREPAPPGRLTALIADGEVVAGDVVGAKSSVQNTGDPMPYTKKKQLDPLGNVKYSSAVYL